ncbi:TrbC/VirB2 family protein [Francisella sp. TX07-6608]|uniref:TrbC/VirB2 family protein n=1 Tax=Francisella sp. TX07-6608 TaxID=573568 RepID=UPI0008F9C23C|nr:TrbC/VirB2 family protein [Francisella sp. TX07-6608]OIN82924.1 trbC/VIRB2 family protein [Francisella sp. TX07-6608]
MRTKRNMLVTIALLISSISTSFASSISSTYAWDSLLSKIVADLSSNVAIAIGIIAIIVCGGIMAFVDLQSGGKRLLQALLGISVAFGAASILSALFSSGAVI